MSMFARLSVLACLAAQTYAGLSVTSVTRGEGARGSEAMNMTARLSVDGEKARIEFLESGNQAMPTGDYLLTRDGGKTMLMVDPTNKTYMTWDMEAMMNTAGQAMQQMGGMVKLTVSDPKVEQLLDEAGGQVAGQATRHYRYRTSYGTTVTVLGMRKASTTVREEDVWATTKLTEIGLGAWLKNKPPKLGNDELDALVRAEMEKVKGFPLKRVSVTTTTDSKGRATTNTVTTEVTELKRTSFPAGIFEIPADFTEQSMPSLKPAKDEEGEDSEPARKTPPVQNPFKNLLRRSL
jgi:hypothetical protein